jgi:Starch binding domain/Alpha amylase, catalytic domain
MIPRILRLWFLLTIAGIAIYVALFAFGTLDSPLTSKLLPSNGIWGVVLGALAVSILLAIDEQSDRSDEKVDKITFAGLAYVLLVKRRALLTLLVLSIATIADAVQRTLVAMGIDQTTMLVNLLDNHDVPRFLGQPDHGTDIESLRRRYHLALTALFTLPGIPQLYYGDELGLYGAGDPSNRADMPSWAWTRSGRSQTNLDVALSPSEPTFSHTQRLIALRKANSALFRGNYAEISRQGTSVAPNLFAFIRMDGGNRIITVLNNGDNSSGIVTLPIWSNGALTRADREALADGTVLDDLLEADRRSAVTLSDGHLALDVSPKTGVIYRPRSHDSASEVKFTIRTTAAFNEALYVSGDIQELGSWDARRAIRMTPSECGGTQCTWSVKLRYLRHGSSVKFRFLRKSDAATAWEGGCDRLYEVPATAYSSYSGGEWHSGGCP